MALAAMMVIVLNGVNLLPSAKADTEQDFTISLKSGWNLISFPVVPTPGYTAQSLLIQLGSVNFEQVQKRNSDGTYSKYTKTPAGWDGTNFAIEPDVGYLVNVKSDKSVVITGALGGERNVQLESGWNLIGWTSLDTTTTAGDILVKLGSANFEQVQKRNSDGTYSKYTKTPAGWDGTDFAIEPGNGYFVNVKSDKMLAILPTYLIQKPSVYTLSNYVVSGNAICLTDTNDYEGVPVLAPIFKNHNKMVSIGWKDTNDQFKQNKLSYASINFDDVSEFSSRIAITFYEVNPVLNNTPISGKKAIVVDSYENALLAGPLACMLNAPILYSGSTTNEALWRVGAIKAEDIISIGTTPYSGEVETSLNSQEEIQNCTVSLATQKGINLNYIAVANPDDNTDSNSGYIATAHLSTFGSLFAAMHNGIVLTVSADAQSIDSAISQLCKKLSTKPSDSQWWKYTSVKYLLMCGDSASLPFVYYWRQDDAINGQGWEFVPSDNPYADLDGDTVFTHTLTSTKTNDMDARLRTPELACGRIVAKTLNDMSSYFDRVFNYGDRFGASSLPADVGLPALSPYSDWQNNAVTWCGLAAEFGAQSLLSAYQWMLLDWGFNTQEDSAHAHTLVGGGLIAGDMAKANFVLADADHGSPQGNTVSYSQLKAMPPNVVALASCLVGKIDNQDPTGNPVTKQDSFTYAILEKGTAAYIAPTRVTLGSVVDGIPSVYPFELYGGSNACGLVYYFFNELAGKDTTTGMAFKFAKTQIQNDVTTTWEYVHYGDPAFNPYEPCNEGKSSKEGAGITSPESNKWAVLVGMSDYPPEGAGGSDLSDCHIDIELCRQYLTSCGFKEDGIKIFLNSSATVQNVTDALEWLVDNADKDSTVFFYYSGHGSG
ncbi:MAG: hypothetical protein CVT83_06525, partial [Alphaproteobacteria bacterium HGW-Alphaproteobacteria-5]